MLINSFKPVRNLALIKTVYKAKGVLLANATKDINLKVLDKTVIAIGPDVTSVKVGDVVALTEQMFHSNIIAFTDNALSMPKVGEIVKAEVKVHNDQNKLLTGSEKMQHNLLNPIAKEYVVVGYVVVGEQDIIGIVNALSEEPDESGVIQSGVIVPLN
jgi:hypothetical protein